MGSKRMKRLWFGGCCYCGRWYSKFGLGLITSTIERNGREVPFHSYCIECEKIHYPLQYTLDMRAVFEQVDRIPWVPTVEEQKWWFLWSIDHWFARRTA